MNAAQKGNWSWDPRTRLWATDHLDFGQLRDWKDVHCHTHCNCLAWSWVLPSLGCKNLLEKIINLPFFPALYFCTFKWWELEDCWQWYCCCWWVWQMWKMMMSTTIEKVRMDDDCHNIGIAPSFGITLWTFLEKCNSYRFGDCGGQSQGNYKTP